MKSVLGESGFVLNRRYQLMKTIGSGAFGCVHLAVDTQSKTPNDRVAVKVENRNCKYPQVVREARLMKLLGLSTRSLGIPRVKWYGNERHYNAMVMELLGPSLEDLFNRCGRRFSLKTVLLLAEQMLKRIEYIHSKNFIHRDIKPDNFLMGIEKRSHVVYLIDFGLAKKYRDSRRIHIPYKDNKHLTGTARYASINNHLGIEQSRRDDLESIGYVLLYFLKGKLPWQNLHAKTKNEKYEKICTKKTNTSIKELTKNQPEEFATYLNYCRSLGFDSTPHYQYLRKLFMDLFLRKGYKRDYVYCWVLEEMESLKKKKKKQDDVNNLLKEKVRTKKKEMEEIESSLLVELESGS